ncbi:MAG: hypothetical protein FJ220_07015 [Kiritimatiellaceae bacterium]|nr:hypothetical protein [Kiritimatiellaceae bacterium]
MNVSIPILVDTIDNDVENAYSGWPNRMFILDAQGKIADKGSAGPGGVRGSMKHAQEILNTLLAETR